MNKRNNIIFCVFGCATIERYKNEILKIQETWGAEAKSFNYKVLFFLGEEKTDLIGEEYIYLDNVGNDYLSATHKQNLGLKYVYLHYEDYDFVYVCGTDTYVVMDILEKEINTLDPTQNICVGGHGCKRIINNEEFYFHSGGAGMILSNNCLSVIAPYLETMYDVWKTEIKGEDLDVASDVALCYYLQKVNCKLIIRDKLFYHCNYMGNPCHHGFKENIIACHNMSLLDFDNYTKILNKKDVKKKCKDDIHLE